MELEDLTKFQRKTNNLKEELCRAKNADYSKADDVHNNFRTVAKLCDVLNVDARTPEGALEYLILHKIHRLFKLKREGKAPENESLFQNNVDLQNFEDLYVTLERFVKALIDESKPSPSSVA